MGLHHYDIDNPRLWEYPITDNSGAYIPSSETHSEFTNRRKNYSTAGSGPPTSISVSERRALQAYSG